MNKFIAAFGQPTPSLNHAGHAFWVWSPSASWDSSYPMYVWHDCAVILKGGYGKDEIFSSEQVKKDGLTDFVLRQMMLAGLAGRRLEIYVSKEEAFTGYDCNAFEELVLTAVRWAKLVQTYGE